MEPAPSKIQALDHTAWLRYNYYKNYFSDCSSVLEIGSAIGSFVHLLKMNGIDAEGLEPDPGYAHYSIKQYGFEQYQMLLEDFSESKKYDALVSFHVLEHVEDPHLFLKKCRELLNDNGQILFEFPSLELYSYGNMDKTIWKPHIHYFTASSVYELFSNYFEVSHIGYHGSALYVNARNTATPNTDSGKFKSYKRKANRSKKVIALTPRLPGKIKGLTAKQVLLQSFVFDDHKKQTFQKYTGLGEFFVKSRLYARKQQNGNGEGGTHITYYKLGGNAGDTILSRCVRQRINDIHTNTSWNIKSLKDKVTDQTIEDINRNAFVVVGGGGLLLPDTNANSISGWQWAISPEHLAEIKVPLFVYAIGYNFFHGQRPGDLFIDNLKKLIDKSSFFSLRNHGSIRAVSELVGEDLAKKIVFQPCPTTVISKFDSNLPAKSSGRNIAINVPFDRYPSRYGKEIYDILDALALGLKTYVNQGYKLFNACHTENDHLFELVLEKHNVPYKSINLQYELPKSLYKFYREMDLVIGGRGHAQMIPYGLNTKIISLGSHNKIKWFLDDIGAEEWLVELLGDVMTLQLRLEQKIDEVINDPNVMEKLISSQEALFEITKSNQQLIKSLL